MTRHHIIMSYPGAYRITDVVEGPAMVPESRAQRLWRFLTVPGRRPEPTRTAPTLATLDDTFLADVITTVAVSLAALRRARPNHQETT